MSLCINSPVVGGGKVIEGQEGVLKRLETGKHRTKKSPPA